MKPSISTGTMETEQLSGFCFWLLMFKWAIMMIKRCVHGVRRSHRGQYVGLDRRRGLEGGGRRIVCVSLKLNKDG